MAKILIPGLSIVTGLAYAYNWIDSSFDSSRWKGDDSLIRNISEYLVIGTVFGSMGGATLWLIYPYPTVLATIVGGGLFIHYAPKIMYTLKKKELI
jgi:hypothetical protein